MRALLALAVVVVLGCAIAGIGMGEGPAQRAPAPSQAAVAAAKQRIAAGGASARRGRELFAQQGCDRCHAIAAIGADGMLGPRLDTVDAKTEENLASITDPRDKIADGFPAKLMPTDFGSRMSDADLQALSRFITTVSGGEGGGGGGGGGKGRGRGRGRGGGG
jgi:cytochrome c551/c552